MAYMGQLYCLSTALALCLCLHAFISQPGHGSYKSQWHGVALHSTLQTWLYLSSRGMGTEVQMRLGRVFQAQQRDCLVCQITMPWCGYVNRRWPYASAPAGTVHGLP